MIRNRFVYSTVVCSIFAANSVLAHPASGEDKGRVVAQDEPRSAIVIAPHSTSITIAQPGIGPLETGSGSTAAQAAKGGKHVKHATRAVVIAVDKRGGTVTLSHAPVKSLKWPAMTMKFLIVDESLYSKFEVGKTVDVHFKKLESTFVVTEVR